jgi:molybdopterin-synthase adenylyltransferase
MAERFPSNTGMRHRLWVHRRLQRSAQLEESCRRGIIPLIDIGMDVHKDDPYSISGQVIVSMPGRPCFRCMGFIRQKDLDAEGRRYGEGGGNPQVF